MAHARAQTKKTSPLVWVGLGALLIGGVVYATGGDDTTTTKKANTVTQQTTTAQDPNSLITDADRKAKFVAVKFEPKDSFTPLVSKATTSGANAGGLPNSITGGDGNWSYTGMVEVDGKPEALLENPKDSQSVYLTVGQHWKRAKVARVSSSDIELVGDDGTVAVVKMGEIAAGKEETNPALQPATIQGPQGQIGGQVDVVPLPGVVDINNINGGGPGGPGGWGGARRRGGFGGGGGGGGRRRGGFGGGGGFGG
jgi:hypothetical protein